MQRIIKSARRIEALEDLPRPFLRRFLRTQDGSMIVFGLFTFVLMLAICGMAIDIMRAESSRARLQGTLDRAVLAAAAMNQELPPETVVNDYFAAADLDNFITLIVSDSGFGYRSVHARAEMELDTSFMEISGVDSLMARAAGTAEERASKAEISLVLDVSGSMRGSKATLMKSAAAQFVETVLTGAGDDESYVNVVPYNAQVSLPPDMFDAYNVSVDHDFSYCVTFAESDFEQTAITETQPLTHLSHFQRYGNDEAGWQEIDHPECRVSTDLYIKPFQSNATTLSASINAMPIGGNTASDLGMKWGVALLDPSARPIVKSLITDKMVAAKLDGHPFDYTHPEALKVLVLMTDGVNTTRYDVKEAFKSGPAPIWRDPESKQTSINLEMIGWPLDDPSTPWFVGKDTSCKFTQKYSDPKGDNPYQMTWDEIWNLFPAGEFGTCFFEELDKMVEASGELQEQYTETFEIVANNSTANAQLLKICTAAKNAGIIVFTIGFEAPSSSQSLMEKCASSPAHYYDVDGIEIENAFAGIAQSVQQLKLVQ